MWWLAQQKALVLFRLLLMGQIPSWIRAVKVWVLLVQPEKGEIFSKPNLSTDTENNGDKALGVVVKTGKDVDNNAIDGPDSLMDQGSKGLGVVGTTGKGRNFFEAQFL